MESGYRFKGRKQNEAEEILSVEVADETIALIKPE